MNIFHEPELGITTIESLYYHTDEKAFLLTIACYLTIAISAQKPNILVIWSNDVGWANISCYNHGMMGYKTSNLDKLAAEGAMFTNWYSQQSCTAGRAVFILGQHPLRTGLLMIGMADSKQGIQPNQPLLSY